MRYYYNRKATADASYRLKTSDLKKWGMLTGEESFEKITWTRDRPSKTLSVNIGVYITNDDPFVILLYTLTDRNGNKTDYKYEVSLVTTLCNFGGVRYWFACLVCHSRVGVLYLPPGEVRFLCRHCYNLSYHSRNRCTMESFGDTSRQIDKLRSEIKRWSYRGRPTRKVRRLQALERKMRILGSCAMMRIERLTRKIMSRRG